MGFGDSQFREFSATEIAAHSREDDHLTYLEHIITLRKLLYSRVVRDFANNKLSELPHPLPANPHTFNVTMLVNSAEAGNARDFTTPSKLGKSACSSNGDPLARVRDCPTIGSIHFHSPKRAMISPDFPRLLPSGNVSDCPVTAEAFRGTASSRMFGYFSFLRKIGLRPP